jgi:hypothetical protein
MGAGRISDMLGRVVALGGGWAEEKIVEQVGCVTEGIEMRL